MQVNEDRSWAQGLSELEFISEYQRRFNIFDVIPSVTQYLKPKKVKESFNYPYRDEYLEVPKEVLKEVPEVKYDCTCGESFAKPLEKARHVRKCKTWLKQTT